MFSSRCSPVKFTNLVSRLNSHDHYMAIQELGFGELIRMKRMKVCKRLCQWVLDSFDVNSCSINVGGKVIKICPNDVVDLFGLPSTGEGILRSVSNIDEICKQYSINISNGLDINMVEEDLITVSPRSIEFKAKFVLFAVGTLLCPNTDTSTEKTYLSCLNNDVMHGRANWAGHVFNYLISGISEYKMMGSR